MNALAKALWFIESHFADEITLAEIARVAGVSRFHMVRAFGVTTGQSVMRYVRGRRLTEAARALAKGAPNILMVALDAGYASHEAFTRAFREQFGLTPDTVRSGGTLTGLLLVEAFVMDKTLTTKLSTPRIEDGRALLVAGLGRSFTFETRSGIPALWQRCVPYIGSLPSQVGRVTYGVCYNSDDAGNFDYIAGVEVADFDLVPEDFARLRITEQRYAVFTHEGHVAETGGTFMAIFNDWLPGSGYQMADAPLYERYDERFDPQTGAGGFEIWVPLKA